MRESKKNEISLISTPEAYSKRQKKIKPILND